MNKIAIIFIGTEKYAEFFTNFYSSCEKKFIRNIEKDYFVFTDASFEGEIPSNIKIKNINHKSWPNITLDRYETILKYSEELTLYDWVIYIDSDMIINQDIKEDEILSDSEYIGVFHPGYYKKDVVMPYERRKQSTAYIEEDGKIYWQGCLWGGKSKSVIKLCKQLYENIEIDKQNNIVAIWHDESHLNKYFLENIEKVNTLTPEYAFPEVYDFYGNDKVYTGVDPNNRKIIHLYKNNSLYHQ